MDSTHIQILKDRCYNLKYILALFNSKLLNFVYKKTVDEENRVFAQVKTVALKRLPIKAIDMNDQMEFVKMVNKILTVTSDEDYLDNLQKQEIARNLEKEIDQMVYKIYELTQNEIIKIESELEAKSN